MAQTFVSYQAGFAVLLVMLGYVVLVEGTVKFDDVAVVIVPLATTYQHVKRLTRSYHVIMESAGALRRHPDDPRDGYRRSQSRWAPDSHGARRCRIA
jgi:uncharacterized protein YifN (PemK superfamily)